MNTRLLRRSFVAATALALAASAVSAQQTIKIFTGGAPSGEGSAYHEGIGQGVLDVLEPIAKEFGYEVELVPSNGSVDNANRLASTTDTLAFGIGQGGLSYGPVTAGQVSIVRNDLPGECAMAFSNEPQLNTWGEIVKNASRITWVVPEQSGSEAFIKRMYAEDSNFGGNAPNFSYATGASNILRTVQDSSKRGMVGFFYAYPNPTAGLVNMAAKDDLKIFGVLSPEIAQTDPAYYLNRRAPYELAWLGLGETKTTRAMCSKALLFVNDVSKIDDSWAAEDYAEIVKQMGAAPASSLVAQSGPLAKLMAQVESLSEEFGVNEMVSDLEEQLQ